MDTFLKSLSMFPDGSKVSKVIMEGMRIGTDADNHTDFATMNEQIINQLLQNVDLLCKLVVNQAPQEMINNQCDIVARQTKTLDTLMR